MIKTMAAGKSSTALLGSSSGEAVGTDDGDSVVEFCVQLDDYTPTVGAREREIPIRLVGRYLEVQRD